MSEDILPESEIKWLCEINFEYGIKHDDGSHIFETEILPIKIKKFVNKQDPDTKYIHITQHEKLEVGSIWNICGWKDLSESSTAPIPAADWKTTIKTDPFMTALDESDEFKDIYNTNRELEKLMPLVEMHLKDPDFFIKMYEENKDLIDLIPKEEEIMPLVEMYLKSKDLIDSNLKEE